MASGSLLLGVIQCRPKGTAEDVLRPHFLRPARFDDPHKICYRFCNQPDPAPEDTERVLGHRGCFGKSALK